jgi:hypothetical protein
MCGGASGCRCDTVRWRQSDRGGTAAGGTTHRLCAEPPGRAKLPLFDHRWKSRPEVAEGEFIAFRRVISVMGQKLPAQSFRSYANSNPAQRRQNLDADEGKNFRADRSLRQPDRVFGPGVLTSSRSKQSCPPQGLPALPPDRGASEACCGHDRQLPARPARWRTFPAAAVR